MKRFTVAISGLSVAGTLAPGLPVIRALHGEPAFVADWRVVGLSYDPFDPPNYDAALLDKSYLLPFPSNGIERLFDRLRYIHERERLDVVIPTLDAELPQYIALYPRLRELGIRLLLPSAAAFRLRSKVELPLVAERGGIRVPRSLVARSADEAIRLALQLPFPMVVKGAMHGATIVYALDQVGPAATAHASQWGFPIVLQEFVVGTEFDVVALANAYSELVGVVPMKKLQIDERGKAWGALTIDDPALCLAAERTVRGLKWVGPLELELVRQRDTGEPYLIEMNPRFPAWVHLATAAGQNLPWALLRLAMGEKVERQAGYHVGVLQLRRAMDVTCGFGAYESLVMHGEVDLTQPNPAWVQTRFVPLPSPSAPRDQGTALANPPPVLAEASAAESATEPASTPAAGDGGKAPAPTPAPSESSANDTPGERLPYERPAILRCHVGVGNRFGGGPGHLSLPTLDGLSVESLAAQYGSPLFVFSERTLREQARTLRDTFLSRYPRVRFAWSYKTNYLDAICCILHEEGWDAEVVSALEYAMARRLGIPGSRIICNGAYKPLAWLEQAVAERALIQVDHFDELDALEAVAKRQGKQVAVGLRVNMRTDMIGGSWERFGFNLDNGEILDAILRIVASRSLRLDGLHCHLGTFICEPSTYVQAAARLSNLFLAAEQLCGHMLSFINLGGGFPSSNTLSSSGHEAVVIAPDMTPFAEGICGQLKAITQQRSAKPTLVLETGRNLVDDAGSLIATVAGTRRLASGERGVVLDAGLNALYTAHWYRHRVTSAQPVPGALEETTLHGPLCMGIDVLRTGVLLPPLAPGHRVVIQPVGAYNVTQWMQFSQSRPAVVMITEDGAVEVIRRAETLADVKGAEILPARFGSPTQLE